MITTVVILCLLVIFAGVGLLLNTISNQGKTINNLQGRLTNKDNEIVAICKNNDKIWNEWCDWVHEIKDDPALTIQERVRTKAKVSIRTSE